MPVQDKGPLGAPMSNVNLDAFALCFSWASPQLPKTLASCPAVCSSGFSPKTPRDEEKAEDVGVESARQLLPARTIGRGGSSSTSVRTYAQNQAFVETISDSKFSIAML